MRIGLAGLPADDLEWIVESVGGRCRDLEDSRVLVTGASGFVGRWIVASLVEIRRQLGLPKLLVEVLVRNPGTARDRLGADLWRELRIHQTDINSRWRLHQPVTHVIHGATPSSLRSGSAKQREVLVTSVLGTHNLVQAVGREERPPRLVHLSSGAVYGPQPSDLARIPESWLGGPSPFLATSPYAEGKRAAEALLEAASRDGLIESIEARLFAFLGPGLPIDEGFAIGNFAGQAARGEDIEVASDGSVTRSYLVARDLSAWLLLLLLEGQLGVPYNVGSPDARALSEWARICAELSGVSWKLGSAPPGERPLYVPDIANSRTLGIDLPRSDPTEALASWIEWLRQVDR